MTDLRPGTVLGGYEVLGPMSQCKSGKVFMVKSRHTRSFGVAKTYRPTGDIDEAWMEFESEVLALKRLNHANICRIYGHMRVGDTFVLILEKCANGSLLDYVKKNKRMRSHVLGKVIKEVCMALNYAWSEGIAHGRIKPSNIVLDDAGRAKIVDFEMRSMPRDRKSVV